MPKPIIGGNPTRLTGTERRYRLESVSYCCCPAVNGSVDYSFNL